MSPKIEREAQAQCKRKNNNNKQEGRNKEMAKKAVSSKVAKAISKETKTLSKLVKKNATKPEADIDIEKLLKEKATPTVGAPAPAVGAPKTAVNKASQKQKKGDAKKVVAIDKKAAEPKGGISLIVYLVKAKGDKGATRAELVDTLKARFDGDRLYYMIRKIGRAVRKGKLAGVRDAKGSRYERFTLPKAA